MSHLVTDRSADLDVSVNLTEFHRNLSATIQASAAARRMHREDIKAVKATTTALVKSSLSTSIKQPKHLPSYVRMALEYPKRALDIFRYGCTNCIQHIFDVEQRR